MDPIPVTGTPGAGTDRAYDSIGKAAGTKAPGATDSATGLDSAAIPTAVGLKDTLRTGSDMDPACGTTRTVTRGQTLGGRAGGDRVIAAGQEETA